MSVSNVNFTLFIYLGVSLFLAKLDRAAMRPAGGDRVNLPIRFSDPTKSEISLSPEAVFWENAALLIPLQAYTPAASKVFCYVSPSC